MSRKGWTCALDIRGGGLTSSEWFRFRQGRAIKSLVVTGEGSEDDKHTLPSSIPETILPCKDDHRGPRSIAQKIPSTPTGEAPGRSRGKTRTLSGHLRGIWASQRLTSLSRQVDDGRGTSHQRHGNHPSVGRSLGKPLTRWCRRAITRPTTATVAVSLGLQVNHPTRETQKLYPCQSSPRSETEKYLPLLLLGRSNGKTEVWFRALYLPP